MAQPADARRGAQEAVERAAQWFAQCRRLDMQGLADELGINRATLFRRVGGREVLLARALWIETERCLAIAAERWESEKPADALHTTGSLRHFNAIVARSKGLRTLLDDEPALAMRILTDPRGPIQQGTVAAVADSLRRDVEDYGLEPIIGPDDLAYALVRIGESFLYADVLAARTPDVEKADRLQRALIEGASA
ncbi:hypothetical protein KDL01_13435 [Actinospica durhamensis]|uniref:QsdR TetR regulatory C-terminal domain-containing protein n=1 Tax=Actinospica durhamensis TaxID=1508375 RepID=A0A941EM90_9ACTN|nr:QsdR family transcriptional regulator [Actinospica durhamensis]MBR7834272.1 hypothetical protein [Actinospica durhamensis]